MDRRADLAIGALVILFGVFVLYTAGGIRPTGPVVDPIGPRGFPYMIGVCFLVGGGAVVFSRLRSWRQEVGPTVESDGEPDEPGVPASAAQAWTVMLAAIGYMLALHPAGYFIATPAFVTVALKAMRMRLGPAALIALVYTLATYVLFALYLKVNLPLGPLDGLFRSLDLVR